MPEPSRLVKLEHIHEVEVGTKIRFLGCVHAYDDQTARLTIRNRYPATARDTPTAVVSVETLLKTLGHEVVEVGAWLNVIGYIRPSLLDNSEAVAGKQKVKQRSREPVHAAVSVEASMIWPAGAIRLEKYNAALEELQEACKPDT